MKKYLIFLMVMFLGACGLQDKPEDRFLSMMKNTLSILEKNKFKPSKAAANLIKFQESNRDELEILSRELKSLNVQFTDEEYNQLLEKADPILVRMKQLIIESPTLLTHPDIVKFYKEFNIGL